MKKRHVPWLIVLLTRELGYYMWRAEYRAVYNRAGSIDDALRCVSISRSLDRTCVLSFVMWISEAVTL